MEDGESLYEGYLFRQHNLVLRGWKAKYFVLTNESLLCFKNRGEVAEESSLPMEDVGLFLEESGTVRRRYCLRLVGMNQKITWNLCCFSAEERMRWFNAIMSAVASRIVRQLSSFDRNSPVRRRPRPRKSNISRSMDNLILSRQLNDSTSRRFNVRPVSYLAPHSITVYDDSFPSLGALSPRAAQMPVWNLSVTEM